MEKKPSHANVPLNEIKAKTCRPQKTAGSVYRFLCLHCIYYKQCILSRWTLHKRISLSTGAISLPQLVI